MKLVSTIVTTAMIVAMFTGCASNQLPAETISSIQAVKDELEIRALAEKFSDAANRKDGALFQARPSMLNLREKKIWALR
jgi:hypothetical protein